MLFLLYEKNDITALGDAWERAVQRLDVLSYDVSHKKRTSGGPSKRSYIVPNISFIFSLYLVKLMDFNKNGLNLLQRLK